MITSPDNQQLKTIRKLRQKRWRERLELFVAEGEDLVEAATAAGWEPEVLLRAGEDVEPGLLAEASGLGSGTRVIGVYRPRWAEPGGSVSVELHDVHDPGNVGAVIRSAHAFCDGPVVLGPGCADPFSPKAVRASMGSVFARPPARGRARGRRIALDPDARRTLADVGPSPPLTLVLGGERRGLPAAIDADEVVRIPLRPDGPESLNVAMAATVALYELATRMAADG
jgi:RNA methyltransferase, TrmH family